MADVHTPEVRSKNMSAIRGRGNLSTEARFLKLLKANHITGWRRHLKRISGRPDFAFPTHKVAIFLDGCFWHKCPVCFKEPKSRVEFWTTKLNANVARDEKVSNQLTNRNWKVLRVWEHELKKEPELVIQNLRSLLLKADV